MTSETTTAETTGPATEPVRYRRARAPLGLRIARAAPTTITLWVVAGIFLFPVLWFVLSSFKPGGELFTYPLTILPEHWTFDGYVQAWERVNFSLYFRNTLVVATVTTVLTVIVSAATGYALAKYRAWWLSALFMCVLATTMLPTEVILSPTFVVIRDLGLYNQLPGIIIPSILTASGIFMFRQFFKTVPDDLIEAARIDGAGELTIFFRIMLPLARPIALTLAIFSFQWRWNDYIWPLLVLGDPKSFTLQVALRSLIGAENIDWTVLLPASVISILPLLAIFLVCQRYIMSSDLNSGIKD